MKNILENQEAPFLSVIIPIYNCERFVKRAAESVLSLPCAEALELILVDDGSTDRSGSICDELAAMHPNVICVHKQNEKLPAARNSGIEAARGIYLAFLDADDWWQKNVLTEELIAVISRSDADLVKFQFRQVGISGRYGNTIRFREGLFRYDAPQAQKEYEVSFCANCFYKQKLCEEKQLRFSPVPMGEDGLFLHFFLCYAQVVLSLPILLMNYWMNPASMLHSANSFHRYECLEAALMYEERLFRSRGFPSDNSRASLSALLAKLPKICAESSYSKVTEQLSRDSCRLLWQEEIQPWSRLHKQFLQWKRHPRLFWLRSRITTGIPLAVKRLLVKRLRAYGLSDYLQYRLKEHWETIDKPDQVAPQKDIAL